MDKAALQEMVRLLEKEVLNLDLLYNELLKQKNKFEDLKNIRFRLKEIKGRLVDLASDNAKFD